MHIDFAKGNGLVPAVVQHFKTFRVLMLGYMNEEAFNETLASGKVCFYSRSKKRLWTKGESSGNFLELKSYHPDCDNDSILIKAKPSGPTCHTGKESCFDPQSLEEGMLYRLENIIQDRLANGGENSYTKKLISSGINRVAQKLGEEAVELVIESKDDNDDKFLGEAADLMYHFTVLLAAKGFSISDVEKVLKDRHFKS